MKQSLFYTILLLIVLTTSKIFADENWKFIKDIEYCFIQSLPIKTEIPEGKTRGTYGILVYSMNKSPDLIVQITAGFNYKSSSSITVKIDSGEHDFYTDGDTAWAKDDKKVIFAMRKGLDLITVGISSKGTKVTDIYSLKGFTAAVNKLLDTC